MTNNAQPANVAHMLDVVLEQQNLKNDAALARALQVAPPIISKARNEIQPLGAALLVKLHEFTGKPTKELKALAGVA
jgi:plasmid maintenance system antidote protein VapI